MILHYFLYSNIIPSKMNLSAFIFIMWATFGCAVRNKRGLVPGTGWQSYVTQQPSSYNSRPYKYPAENYNTPPRYYNPTTTAAPQWGNGGQGWGYGSGSNSYSGSFSGSYGTGGYGSSPGSSYGNSPSWPSGRDSYSNYGDYYYNYYDDDVEYSLIGRDGRKYNDATTTTQPPQVGYSLIGRDGRQPQRTKPLKSICQQNEIEKLKRYAFYKNHSRCYEIGSKGPCQSNMRFYLEETGSEYGLCDCDANVGYNCGRPLIYDYGKDWCFPAYSRGPCQSDSWFVLDIKGRSTCERNPCSDFQRTSQKKDSDCEHWISVKGRCYETTSQAYCLYNEELKWNVFDSWATAPQCSLLKQQPNAPSNGWGQSLSWSASSDNLAKSVEIDKSLPCLPGMRQTQSRKCIPNKITSKSS